MIGERTLGTRARRDPHRRTGNANAVAAGIDLTQVGVVGERELNWIRRLANETEGEIDAYLKREEERRKALSAARTANWTDTKEAKHGEFIRSQAAAIEEAERRREELDVLFAEQEREAHRALVAQLELKQLKEDPRGRNVHHMVMLHEAIKGREEQIAYEKSKVRDQLAEEQRELEEKLLKAWGEEAEERRKAIEVRQKNVQEKATNLETVMFQLEQRKKQRVEEKARRAFVEREAMEEKLENAEEERVRKQREYESGMWNQEHSRKAVTKHQRLDERIAEFAEDEKKRLREEAFLDNLRKTVEEKRRKKQEEFEKRKQEGVQAYLAEAGGPSPTYRTQDAFVKRGVNFVNILAEENDKRQAKTKEDLRKTKEFEPDSHRKAEASASGFKDIEEEEDYLEEMRLLPEKVRAEEAQKAAMQKMEADRIARIQRMQAVEKKKHDRLQVEKERDNARRTREQMEEDDKRYSEYIKSQIPQDMDPYLRERAMRMT